jgi:integrase/recombinase XerD
MATLSLVLDKRRKKKDSTYPLVFQVVMNSVPVKISTGISVRECEFDSVNGIIKESSSVNKELFRVEETYRKKLDKFCLMNPTCVSGVELKNYLLNKSPDEFTIAEFWETTIQELITMGRLGGANVYKQSKTAIEKHADLKIPFNKFTYRDLLNLEQQLYLSRILMDQD